MKIDAKTYTLFDPYAAGSLDKTTQARTDAAAAAPQTEGGGDTVSVSQDALLLTEARRTAQSTPDVRADKVESLRQQVAAGTSGVDSRRIAESLIREEPGLFQL